MLLDFVTTGRTKELLEEIKPLVEGFLRERGLEVSPVKTVITRKVDCAIFTSLWQWARRKHPTKSRGWIQQKYWGHDQRWNWTFFGVWQKADGESSVISLQHARKDTDPAMPEAPRIPNRLRVSSRDVRKA